MIFFSQFGYALRHRINFDVKRKSGSLMLWSHYDGISRGSDPMVNGEDSSTEFLVHQSSGSILFGGNRAVEFPLGNDDVFLLLEALIRIKDGNEYSFSNYQDRLISFSSEKKGKMELIIVKIRYSDRTGKLTLKEVNELKTLTRDILSDLGYSKEDVAKRLTQ